MYISHNISLLLFYYLNIFAFFAEKLTFLDSKFFTTLLEIWLFPLLMECFDDTRVWNTKVILWFLNKNSFSFSSHIIFSNNQFERNLQIRK